MKSQDPYFSQPPAGRRWWAGTGSAPSGRWRPLCLCTWPTAGRVVPSAPPGLSPWVPPYCTPQPQGPSHPHSLEYIINININKDIREMYGTGCGRICMSKFEILINFLKQIWTRYKFDDIKLMQQTYFVLFNSINKVKRFYSLHGIWWMH